jgi:hypothetical protein
MLNLMFVSFNSNTIGVTWGARTANPSGSPQVFSGVHVARSLVFCVMFCRSLYVLLSFFFWPLCGLSFFDLRILITPLVSWPLCCLSFFDLQILITPLVSWPLCCLSFFDLRILITSLVSWPLCCLSFFDLQILITSLWYLQTFLNSCYICIHYLLS